MSGPIFNKRRAAARRYVMSGYPIETPFAVPDDVWAYLNANRITCLRCGKQYKALVKHLPIHGWDTERYKEFYGLPWGTGLTSSPTRTLNVAHGKALLEAGIAFGGVPGVGWEKTLAAPRRKRAPYLKVVSKMNFGKASLMHRPRPEKTHCPKAHPYPPDRRKRCQICDTEQKRLKLGYLSRSEPAKIEIIVACSFCGTHVKRLRRSGRNRKVRCCECFLAYQKKYSHVRAERRQAG